MIDYSLPIQMKPFGPPKNQFLCMGKKVSFWQTGKLMTTANQRQMSQLFVQQKYLFHTTFTN